MTQKFSKNDRRINRQGRRKGVQNRSTNELRMLVQDFIEHNWQTLQQSFDALEGKDKLNTIDRLLKHCLPAPMSELERLTDEQLDILIQKLKQQKYDTQRQN